MSDVELVENVLLNPTVQNYLIHKRSMTTLQFFSNLLSMEEVVKNDDVDVYIALSKITKNFNQNFAEYCKDAEYIETSEFANYKFSNDATENKAILGDIYTKRASKNLFHNLQVIANNYIANKSPNKYVLMATKLYNAVKDGKISKDDFRKVKILANSLPIEQNRKALYIESLDKVIDNPNVDNCESLCYMASGVDIVTMLSDIQYYYHESLQGLYDNVTYLKETSDKNIMFNQFLQYYGITLRNIKASMTDEQRKQIVKKFEDFTNGRYSLITDGTFKIIDNENKDNLDVFYKELNTGHAVDKNTAMLFNTEKMHTGLVNKSLSQIEQQYVTVDDVLRNTNLLSDEARQFLIDNGYVAENGQGGLHETFAGLKDYIEKSSNYQNTLLCNNAFDRFYIANTGYLSDMLNSKFSKISNFTVKNIFGTEDIDYLVNNKVKIPISKIIGSDFLLPGLDSINIVVKRYSDERGAVTNGSYNADEKIIYISSKLLERSILSGPRVNAYYRNEMRDCILHEYYHAVQTMFGLPLGSNRQFFFKWFPNVDDRLNLVYECAKYFVKNFSDKFTIPDIDKAMKVVNGQLTIVDAKLYASFEDKIFYLLYSCAGGELLSNGQYVSQEHLVLPIIMPCAANGGTLILPNGKQFKSIEARVYNYEYMSEDVSNEISAQGLFNREITTDEKYLSEKPEETVDEKAEKKRKEQRQVFEQIKAAVNKNRQIRINKDFAKFPFLKPYKNKLVDSRVVKAIFSAEAKGFEKLDKDFVDLIKSGNLNKKYLDWYIQSHDWVDSPTDAATYSLLVASMFDNAKELDYKTFLKIINQEQESGLPVTAVVWAFKESLIEAGFDSDEIDKRLNNPIFKKDKNGNKINTLTDFEALAKYIASRDEVGKIYDKYLRNFAKGKIGFMHDLTIDKNITGLLLLKNYDGTYGSIYNTAETARNYAYAAERWGNEKGIVKISIDNEAALDAIANKNKSLQTGEDAFDAILDRASGANILTEIRGYLIEQYIEEHPFATDEEIAAEETRINDLYEDTSIEEKAAILVGIEEAFIIQNIADFKKYKNDPDFVQDIIDYNKKKLKSFNKSKIVRFNRNFGRLKTIYRNNKENNKLFLSKYKEYFAEQNGELVFVKDINGITADELNQLNDIINEAKYGLLHNAYRTKTDLKVYMNSIKSDFEKRQEGKGKQQEFFSNYNDERHKFVIDGSVEMPEKLKDLLKYSFTKLTEQEVQYLSEKGNKDKVRIAMKKFLEDNKQELADLTPEEVMEIVNFYENTSLSVKGELDATAIRAYSSIEVELLTYFDNQAKYGNLTSLSSSDIVRIEELLKLRVSTASTVLSVWRNIMSDLNPNKYRYEANSARYKLDFDETEIETLADITKHYYDAKIKGDMTAASDYLSQIARYKKTMYEKCMAKAKAFKSERTRDNILEKILSFERACMLSSPATWVRNVVSNNILTAANNASDFLGNFLSKPLDKIKSSDSKFFKKISKFLTPEAAVDMSNQYKIYGTEVTADVVKFVESTKEMFDLVVTNASRFSFDLTQSTDTIDVLMNMIKSQVSTDVFNKNQFSTKGLQTFYNIVARATSDDKFITKKAVYYYGKMLTEDVAAGRIDLEKLSANDPKLLRIVSSAYTMSLADYMHTNNWIYSIESYITQRWGVVPKFVLKQFLPFVGSAWNWTMEILRYTPAGALKSIVDYVKIEKSIEQFYNTPERGNQYEQQLFSRKSELETKIKDTTELLVKANKEKATATIDTLNKQLASLDDQLADVNTEINNTKELKGGRFKEYIAKRNLGKGVIGTTACIVGMILAELGVIALDDDDDKLKLTFGKVSVDITNVFGSSSLFIGAALVGACQDEEYKFINTLEDAFNVLFDDSVFMNTFDAFNFKTSNFTDISVSVVESFLSKLQPNILKSLTAIIAPQKTKYDSGLLGFLERWSADMIPGLAYAYPYQVDIYTGKTLYDTGSSLGYGLFSRITKKISGIQIKVNELSDEQKFAIARGVSKGQLTGNYDDIGKLSIKDVRKLNMKYGELNAETIKELEKNPNKKYTVLNKESGEYENIAFSRMTQEQQKTVIERLMTENAKYAKIYVYTQSGGKYYTTNGEEYKRLKKLGITNVYKTSRDASYFN